MYAICYHEDESKFLYFSIIQCTKQPKIPKIASINLAGAPHFYKRSGGVNFHNSIKKWGVEFFHVKGEGLVN